jgi:hypothetical protein
LGDFRIDQSYAGLPATLPMDEAAAEALVKGVRYESDRQLVLAMFGQLTLSASDRRLSLEPSRVGIFRNSDLQLQLAELDPAGFLVSGAELPSAALADTGQAWAGRLALPVYEGVPLFTPEDFPGHDTLAAATALFALAARPDLLEQPGLTMQYAFALDIDLAPYLTAAAARQYLERNFRPEYASWGGADEFQREDSRKRFLAENRERMLAMLPQFPLEIAVLRRAAIAQYDASAGGFPLDIVTRQSVSPYNGAVELTLELPSSGEDDPLLAMTEPEARQFREMLRGLTATQLDPATFRTSSIGIPAGELATVSRYRVTGASFDYGDLVLDVTPIDRKLHPLSDLATVILDLPYPDAPDPGSSAESVASTEALSAEQRAILDGSADAPQSSFDILGIRLGMPLEEAKALLEARLEGRNAVPLSVTTVDSGPKCARIESEMDVELAEAVDADTVQRIRDSYIDDFARAECGVVDLTVVQVAFGYDVPQEDGQVDRIVVFKATQSGDVVGAVAREVSDGMLEALTNGLIDKYGTAFIGDEGSEYRVWPSDPSMAPLFNGGYDCTPSWPDLIRIPEAYRTRNCGAFVRQLYRQVLLIDTRYNALQYQRIIEKVAAAEAVQPKPKLDF